MRYLSKILNYFRKPDEETVEAILEKIGIAESDESYETLKTGLRNLIGRKTREKSFSKFFKELTSQLYKKIDKELSERDETIDDLIKEIIRSRKQIVAEVMAKAFSPKILAIIDRPSYELLKLLYEGEKSYKLLKGIWNLKDDDLIWRIKYFEDFGVVKSHYSEKIVFYSLSNTGKIILEKRGSEFEELVDLLREDKDYRLALKAVGENKVMAEKFLNWLKSSRGRGHMSTIEKLSKVYETPKKVSQAFFSEREMGVTHEKHMGIKIIDHRAAGELLLSELGKFHRKVVCMKLDSNT